MFRIFKSRINTFIVVMKGQSLILNYQVGKVGSSSIAEYLKQNNIHEWHIHRFYNFPVHNKNKKNTFTFILDIALLKLAKRRCKKIYVITGFREPVSRDLSMFFHSFEHTHYDDDLTFKELEAVFRSKYDIGKSVDWFELEFNKIFNINVYDFPFQTENGYTKFISNNINFFIYDMKFLNSLEKQIGEFLEIEGYRLIKSNDSSSKPYKQKYKDFTEFFSLNDVEISYVLNSQYAKHFYEKNVLEGQLKKWTK